MRQKSLLSALLGMPVKLSNGIDDKHSNQTYIHKGFLSMKTGCSGGPAWGTEPKQHSVAEVYWTSVGINIGLI